MTDILALAALCFLVSGLIFLAYGEIGCAMFEIAMALLMFKLLGA